MEKEPNDVRNELFSSRCPRDLLEPRIPSLHSRVFKAPGNTERSSIPEHDRESRAGSKRARDPTPTPRYERSLSNDVSPFRKHASNDPFDRSSKPSRSSRRCLVRPLAKRGARAFLLDPNEQVCFCSSPTRSNDGWMGSLFFLVSMGWENPKEGRREGFPRLEMEMERDGKGSLPFPSSWFPFTFLSLTIPFGFVFRVW